MRLTWRVKRLEKRAADDSDPGARGACTSCGGGGYLVLLIEGRPSAGAPCPSCGAAITIDYVVRGEEEGAETASAGAEAA